MEKEFQKWHKKKEEVEKTISRPFFHERENWYCVLGIKVGFEQDGKGKDFLLKKKFKALLF